jgi:hypothetical protein
MEPDPHDLQAAATSPEVFISYARRDYDKVRFIADQLTALGIDSWLDQKAIEGGENYARAIVRGIKLSRVFLLMCSDAALRSRNVNQEILLAWKYRRPYLPLLLEPVSFPEQVEYFLEGCQWVEVFGRTTAEWWPDVRRALAEVSVPDGAAPQKPTDVPIQSPPTEPAHDRDAPARADLTALLALASFNDRIWPVADDSAPHSPGRNVRFRDLGVTPHHRCRLGSRLRLAIEAERAGHLLLLDVGTAGAIYCLAPSWFAPDARVREGLNYLPEEVARYKSFQVSGRAGREHLLAIVTDEPMGLNWMPHDPDTLSRSLDARDVELLLARLHRLDPAKWAAYATFLEIVP